MSRLIALTTIKPEIKTNVFFYNCMTNEGKVRVEIFCNKFSTQIFSSFLLIFDLHDNVKMDQDKLLVWSRLNQLFW
jgi:hypothetical protein